MTVHDSCHGVAPRTDSNRQMGTRRAMDDEDEDEEDDEEDDEEGGDGGDGGGARVGLGPRVGVSA